MTPRNGALGEQLCRWLRPTESRLEAAARKAE